MNKRPLLDQIIAQLRSEVELLDKAARTARAEATHESSKAENKYDTRGLEAGYLASGQARLAAEAEVSLQKYQALTWRAFTAADPIGLSALVELEEKGARSLYLLGPRAGGLELDLAGRAVLVITPQSPLGAQLMEKKSGDRIKAEIAGRKVDFKIVSVA